MQTIVTPKTNPRHCPGYGLHLAEVLAGEVHGYVPEGADPIEWAHRALLEFEDIFWTNIDQQHEHADRVTRERTSAAS